MFHRSLRTCTVGSVRGVASHASASTSNAQPTLSGTASSGIALVARGPLRSESGSPLRCSVGSQHRETTYTAADALAVLPVSVRAIESFDPALVRSAVPNYMLSEFTAQHVKVVLTGEGADELFAGYEYLRDFTDPETLHRELVRTVESLHNLNLQRCDRVTMAHGLEARVPFLDREVIEWALRLPPGFKLAGPGQPEKRLLREAFDGWLPHELLWRDKAEFGDGSGAKDVLSAVIEAEIFEAEFELDRDLVTPPLRTREELAYFRIFREHLAGVRPELTLSRFATA